MQKRVFGQKLGWVSIKFAKVYPSNCLYWRNPGNDHVNEYPFGHQLIRMVHYVGWGKSLNVTARRCCIKGTFREFPHIRFLALISFVASCMSYWNYWISWYVWRLKIPVAFNVDCGWKSRNRAIHGSVCKSIWGFARVEADWLEFRKSREVWQLDAFVTSKSFCTCDYLRGSEF